MGRGISGLGQGVLNLGLQLQDTEDDARATEANNRFLEHVGKVVHGPGGYLTLQEKQAVEGRDKALADLEAEQRRLLESLQTPGQIDRAGPALQTQFARAKAQIDSHYNRQVAVDAEAQHVANVKLSTSRYVTLATGDPATRDAATGVFGDIIAASAAIAAQRGWAPGSPQERKLMLDTRSNAHRAVVESLLDQQRGTEAKSYLDDVLALDAEDRRKGGDGEIDPELAARLQGPTKIADTEDVAARLALTLGRPPADTETRLMQTQFSDDPKSVFLGMREARARAVNEARAQLQAAFESGGKVNGVQVTREVMDRTLARIDADYRATQEGESRSMLALVESSRQKLRQAVAANPVVDPAQVIGARDRAALEDAGMWDAVTASKGLIATTPRGFAAITGGLSVQDLRDTDLASLLRAYRRDLDDDDMMRLAKMHAEAQKPGKEFVVDDPLTPEKRTLQTARELDILPQDGSEPSPEQLAAFKAFEVRWADEQVAEATRLKVEKLTPTQLSELLRRVKANELYDRTRGKLAPAITIGNFAADAMVRSPNGLVPLSTYTSAHQPFSILDKGTGKPRPMTFAEGFDLLAQKHAARGLPPPTYQDYVNVLSEGAPVAAKPKELTTLDTEVDRLDALGRFRMFEATRKQHETELEAAVKARDRAYIRAGFPPPPR